MRETVLDAKIYGRALVRVLDETPGQAKTETLAVFMRRVAIDGMVSFENEIDQIRYDREQPMRDVLVAARDKFSFYAEQHRAKATEDSLAKAVVNEQMVAMINAVLIL